MTNDPANVVVVVLDTVRGLDTVPASGSGLSTLASLAEEGAEYRQAYASAPWTLPSHAGLFTGTYTSKHGTHGANPVLDGTSVTLAEALSEEGYETRAISNNTWISDEFGFGRGFEVFHTTWTQGASGSSDVPPDSDVPSDSVENGDDWRTRATKRCGAGETTDLAVDWLSTMGRRPFFLFVNYIDAHFQYAPPEEYVADGLPAGYDYDGAVDVLRDPREYDAGEVTLTDAECAALRALYRSELAYLDDNLRRLVDGMKDVGVWEETVLVVTSDHGENIGEHGFVGHQYNLYDTLLHVPLVITGGSFDRNADTERLVQLPDLAPTILDEVGIEASTAREQFQGRSFHPRSSVPAREYVVAEHVAPRPSVKTLEQRFGDLPEPLDVLDRSLPLRAVRTGEYKLVLGSDGARELYHVDVDPMETEDVNGRQSDVGDRLEGELNEWLAAFDQRIARVSTTISPESKERLRDLGYL